MTNARTEMVEPRLAPSDLLREKLAAVRRKQVSVAAGRGLATAVLAFVILLAVAMLTDWWLDLPRWARTLGLLMFLGVPAVHAWRFVVTPLRRQPDDDTVALTVEKSFPQFRSRLISSIQFPRPGGLPSGAAPSLVRMTIAETEELARPLDFTGVIPTGGFARMSAWAVAVAALGLFSYFYGADVSRDLLKRAFLSSTLVPRHTRVEILTGDPQIGRGDAIRIEAMARGVVPKSGRLLVKTSGKRTQEYTLDRDKDGRFVRTLENVQQDFTYSVRLNDGVSRTHRVTVVPRPSVVTMQCEQTFPAYTGLPVARRALGDLTLLAGSRLSLTVAASHEIKRASIRLVGLSNSVPMQISAQNPRELRGQFDVPAKGLSGFAVDMIDKNEMTSLDSAIYRIDVVPDRAPKIRVTYPDRREELVTRQAVQPVAFEAADDFRVARLRLRYRVGEAEDAVLKAVELEPGTNAVREVRSVYEWSLQKFQPPLAEGTRIEYWLEAEDNNNVTGPGLGVTEHQLLRVVSENDKRADLLNRAGDFIGTISDVAGDQEKLNTSLGTLIMERAKPR